MTLYSAIKKLLKRKRERSYYNSEFILTAKEKQSLIVVGFLILFPIIIGTSILLIS